MSDKSAKLRTPQLATAALIIKGALYELYKTDLSVGNKFESTTKGRVIVHYNGPKPDDSDIAKVQALVDKIIKENLKVIVSENVDRAGAEQHYKNFPVNGQFIYEKKAPPAELTSITLAEIKDWAICSTPSKEFVESTNLVGTVQVMRFNHRENKEELEVCYQMEAVTTKKPSKVAVALAAQQTSSSSTAPTDTLSFAPDSITDVRKQILSVVFETIKKNSPDISAEQLTKLHDACSQGPTVAQIEVYLTMLKNVAYSKGFTSKQN